MSHVFPNARHFSISNSHFISSPSTINQHGKSGLEILLGASIPEAAHDSFARYPPPRCHPGTRKDYIEKIVTWGLESNGPDCRILWMEGPAGVGKSAVAQSCAEALKGKLGASFFFSRPNTRDNPNCLFTSISHQLTTKYKPYQAIVDAKTRDDPTIVTKSLAQQFQDLIVAPLQELRDRWDEIGCNVIIIDGLDECASREAQLYIIDIIAASVRDQTTPFIWAIFSRAEPGIATTFSSEEVSPLSLHIEMPVSRDIDHEIALFLTDELKLVQKRNGLPPTWPAKRHIWTLVKLSAGLFIYAATLVRFIGEINCAGPRDQLLAVLSFAKRQRPRTDSEHPLSALHRFYMLIMQCVPSKILSNILKILLVSTFPSWGIRAIENANLLGLSEWQFTYACRALYSVLYIEDAEIPRIRFYHASFMDFLRDPARSEEFCITSSCAQTLRSELLGRLNSIHAVQSLRSILIAWDFNERSRSAVYQDMVEGLFILCQSIPLDEETLAALENFNYDMIPILREGSVYFHGGARGELLFKNVPQNRRQKIIRPLNHLYFRFGLYPEPKGAKSWTSPYVLGHGKTKVLYWQDQGATVLRPFPPSRIRTISRFFRGKATSRPDNIQRRRAISE